jgi:glycosyltransferase involved in cell wall biosynthesis
MNIGILGLWGMDVPGASFGGFETGFSEIAARLVEDGHDVTIYCRRGAYPPGVRPREHQGVRLTYIPSGKAKSSSFLIAVSFATLAALARRRHDVFLYVNVGSGWHCLVSRLLGAKVVINVDGLDWTRGKWGRLARAYFRSAARAALFASDVVVTDAHAMVDYYVQHYAYAPEMIAYGATIGGSTKPELLRPFSLEPDSYYLIASRLVPENNADIIVRAFEQLQSSRRLLIVGDSNYDSPFHRQLHATQDSRVQFTGWIDDPETIRELHANATAYIHGHSVGGTNPALLKALAYGNCVLALDTPFNSEVLGGGKFGLLWERDPADLLDKLRFVEANSEIREGLRSAAPGRIEQAYTWERITGQYEKLLVEVASGRSASKARIIATRAGLAAASVGATLAATTLLRRH